MYLTLDKKGGLPVIFCSKCSKDDGRGGKLHEESIYPTTTTSYLYLLNTAQIRYVVLKRVWVCPNLNVNA